jgi:TM2 domain-containing membrane protein YozV
MNYQTKKFIAYALCFVGFFGVAGLHHVFLGNYIRAILYFFTFGLLFIGTIIDLFTIPSMLEKRNKLDVAILKICRSKHETTFSDLVIETNGSPDEIKRVLDQLCRQNLLTMDNRATDGAIVYKTI